MINLGGTETDTSCDFIFYIEPVSDPFAVDLPIIQAERLYHAPVRRLSSTPMTHSTRRSWLLASAVRGRR